MIPLRDCYLRNDLVEPHSIDKIPITKSYRYLGVEIDKDGLIGLYIERIRKRMFYLYSTLR